MPYILAPNSSVLAMYATQTHPDHFISWFWLAETEIRKHTGTSLLQSFDLYKKGSLEAPIQVIQHYQKGLSLTQPSVIARVRWIEYGHLMAQKEPEKAMQAYSNACDLGHRDGCQLAGHIAERLGKLELAVQYFRASGIDIYLKRADEVQATIEGTYP
ncbi:MAG: hypothetical protein ACOYYS_27595 [Chloroflexota bacterium]